VRFPDVASAVDLITDSWCSYKFNLPQSNAILGLPIGQHVSLAATIDGKEIVRSYTPISSDADRGHFNLLIKSYPTGNISKFVANMKIGQTIKCRGPKGQFVYTPNMARAFAMIAGGTGITPMLQIVRAITENPEDKTQIDLLFANVNQEDILLKEDLDELAANHENFRVHYVLNNPPEGWKGGVGFVTADMIKVRACIHSPQLNSFANEITGLVPRPRKGCQGPHLRSSPHGQCDEEGDHRARIRAGQARF